MAPLPIHDLAVQLQTLTDLVVTSTEAEFAALTDIHPRNQLSAKNLLHYLALRSTDLRELQLELAQHGLSTLGRSEAQVEASLRATTRAACALAGRTPPETEPEISFDYGAPQLSANAEALFGPKSPGRTTRIMVTLPSEAATDPELVLDFADEGASVFRINAAHDDVDAWTAMVTHVRAAQERVGRHLVVVVDLAGPKLRTGPIAPGPQVRKFKPQRDVLGRTTVPATVICTDDTAEDRPDSLPVHDRAWLTRRSVGDHIRFQDARGSNRTMTVTEIDNGQVSCALPDTAYLTTGLTLQVEDDQTTVGDLPAVEQRIRVHHGDQIRLVSELSPADPDQRPITIGCTLPEALRDAVVGDRVAIDDGKFFGAVVETDERSLVLEVTSVAPQGA